MSYIDLLDGLRLDNLGDTYIKQDFLISPHYLELGKLTSVDVMI